MEQRHLLAIILATIVVLALIAVSWAANVAQYQDINGTSEYAYLTLYADENCTNTISTMHWNFTELAGFRPSENSSMQIYAKNTGNITSYFNFTIPFADNAVVAVEPQQVLLEQNQVAPLNIVFTNVAVNSTVSFDLSID